MIAIIPARKGSKRLVRKNLRKLRELPLIDWSVKAAKNSGTFSEIYVTTDDSEIMDYYEGDQELKLISRPAELATDVASSSDVILHTLKQIQNMRPFFLLQPTSPLRTSSHIQEAYHHYVTGQFDSVVSVCRNNKNNKEYRLKTLIEAGILPSFVGDCSNLDINEYCLNGAIFVSNEKSFCERGGFYSPNMYFYEMPIERSIDIDNINDFRYAEKLLNDDHGA